MWSPLLSSDTPKTLFIRGRLCVRLQCVSEAAATGFCVALDVTETLLGERLPGLMQGQLTAHCHQRTAASALKGLPQFHHQ